jgi:hypothetical protein
MFIVELQTGTWLAPWLGDPGRTEVEASARRYKTEGAAKIALKYARRYRPFKNAKIVRLG